MEFFVGIFILAYGGGVIWAIVANDRDRGGDIPAYEASTPELRQAISIE